MTETLQPEGFRIVRVELIKTGQVFGRIRATALYNGRRIQYEQPFDKSKPVIEQMNELRSMAVADVVSNQMAASAQGDKKK